MLGRANYSSISFSTVIQKPLYTSFNKWFGVVTLVLILRFYDRLLRFYDRLYDFTILRPLYIKSFRQGDCSFIDDSVMPGNIEGLLVSDAIDCP